MKGVLVFRYDLPDTAHETPACEALDDALDFFAGLCHAGICEPAQGLISANRGMLLVPGEPRRLRAILGTDRFSSIYLRAGGVVSNLTYELMLGCDEAPAGIASWNRRRDALQVVS